MCLFATLNTLAVDTCSCGLNLKCLDFGDKQETSAQSLVSDRRRRLLERLGRLKGDLNLPTHLCGQKFIPCGSVW